MTIIIPLLFIFSGSVFAAAFLKKAAEEMIPITIMSIVLVLYASYCFDLLIWGFYIVVAAGILCYLSVFYLIRKIGFKQSYMQLRTHLLTPGILIFLLICICVYIITRNNIVSLWDELRLWGAYPKILFHTDKLQLADNSILYEQMRSYPPGMPLFVYFFEKFGATFSESHIFLAYGIFGTSIFMPALKKLKWKDASSIIPLTFIILIIPLLFYNSFNDYGDYYKSLFIDSTLGLLLAYDIYLLTTDCFKNWFNTYRFMIALTATILIKDSGVIFTICALLGALLLEFFVFGKNQYKDRKSALTRITRALFSGCISLGVYFSWKHLLTVFSVHNHIKIDIFPINFDFIGKFIKALFKEKVIESNFFANNFLSSFVFIFTFILFINIFIVILNKKQNRKIVIISSCCLFFSNFVFIIGLYFLFEAFDENFFSFARYISTILLGDISFLFIIFINNYSENIKKVATSITLKNAAILIIISSIIILPIRKPVAYYGYWNEAASEHSIIISSYINNDSNKNDNSVQNVYIVMDKNPYENAGLHHRIYFNLLDKDILIKNFYNCTTLTIAGESSQEDVQYAISDFKKTLLEDDYDYVYIAVDDPLLEEQFNQLFGEDIEVQNMYKVLNTNDKITLVKMQ